jgi:hypothetical protein
LRKCFSVFIILCLFLSCGQNSKKLIQDSTEISFLLSGNWIFIKLKLNKADHLYFIIDTGVDETIINKRTAELLNFKFHKKANFSGAFENDTVYYSENNTIFIDNLKLDSIILVQVPLENFEQTFGMAIDGFLGEALFKKHIVNIDFEKGKIQLFNDKKDFIQKDSLFSIDLKIINKVPVIQTSFVINDNDTLSGNFMLDLGFKNSIAFNSPYTNKNNLISKIDKYYTFNASGLISEGKSYMARMKKFKLGNNYLDNIPYMLNQSSAGTLSTTDYDGMIGMDILTRYTSIGFDYKNKKLYLGKYKYIKDSVYSDVNCSGLELKKIIGTYRIVINAVYNNSPASEAGLKLGDELIFINGKEISKYEYTEVKRILREKGKLIDIQVKRGSKNLNFKLNLRELI